MVKPPSPKMLLWQGRFHGRLRSIRVGKIEIRRGEKLCPSRRADEIRSLGGISVTSVGGSQEIHLVREQGRQRQRGPGLYLTPQLSLDSGLQSVLLP